MADTSEGKDGGWSETAAGSRGVVHSILIEAARVAGRQRHSGRGLAIERDLEGVRPSAGERHVENQHGARFDIGHAGRGLAELHRALAAEQLSARLIHEANADAVHPDLGAPAANPEHEMRAWVHRRKGADPHMLENAENREFALLIDQGVVREDREVDLQVSLPEWS